MTLKEIAQKAGVSITTVSRVVNGMENVNDDTCRRVMEVATQGGYFQKKKNEKANVVAALVPDLSNPFFVSMISGIHEIMRKQSKEVVIMDTLEDVEQERRALASIAQMKNLCGLIMTPVSDSGEDGYAIENKLNALEIPVVLVDRDVKNSTFDGVFLNNILGAFQAADYLIEHGNRRIAIIAGPAYSKPGRERLKGYLNALEKHQIDRDDSLIFEGDFSVESGYQLTKEILARPKAERPDALFTCNNSMTNGAVKALIEAGVKFGERGELGLAAFDEAQSIDILNLDIPVVVRPTKEMGRVAAQILLRRLGQENKEESGRRIELLPMLREKKKKEQGI